MGTVFSFISSIFSGVKLDNQNIENSDREYIAIDQSGTLGSLFDDRQDTIMGKLFNNLRSVPNLINGPITCKLYKGHTIETENLLDIVEIDYLLQLSLISKVIPSIGIASIIDYSQSINEYTRFLYYNQISSNESCYDDLVNREKVDISHMCETCPTHIITKISCGIHLVVILQLPINQVVEIDHLLEQICSSLTKHEYHLEMTSHEKDLFNKIIPTAVYSNIPDLIKLTRLDDIYQKLCRIHDKISEHRRLKYLLSSIQLFCSDDLGKNVNHCEIDQNQIKQVNRYFYQQLYQINALKFHFDDELIKLPQNKLEEQLKSFQQNLSRLIQLYESDATKNHRLIQSIRRGETMMHAIDQFSNSEAQIQIKGYIQRLATSLYTLILKGDFIKQLLEKNGFEYLNVATVGIDQNTDEKLVKDILLKNNPNKLIFCSTDQLKQHSSEQWNILYFQIMEEKQKNPQLILIYADFTYSTCPLEKMIVLSLKDQTISVCESSLETISSPLKSTEEFINILLLGDSGVGKSTFINAFANYLQFNSLKQAQSGQPIVVIPVSFLITTNDDFDEQIIKFGESDPNENHNDLGQSVTQQCRSYVFEISPGKKLRIIDTPGFADTRGDSQDEINMNMIISFLNNLTHLNGVCILFKPDVARLNTFLYTYFTQIFQCFGENIREHLIFCFTNARTTFFAPGNTRPILKSFFDSFSVRNISIEKKNTFCFDSESFRYLVALQNKIKFDTIDEVEFEKSWTRSVEESQRLKTFLCNKLHPYRKNIEWQSIKNAQCQINFMIRPMLETIRNILRNILLFDINCSIKLKAICVHRPTWICYKCKRISKIFNQFEIFSDLIHHSQNEYCCSSDEQIPIEYILDYESLNSRTNDSKDILHQQQIFLSNVCVQFAGFLRITKARKDDPFLSGLIRMLNEEESICQKQNERSFNQDLVIQLKTFINDYQQTNLAAENKLLPEIYELITSVIEIPMMKEQIHAINEYQQLLLTSNEYDIDIQNISLQ